MLESKVCQYGIGYTGILQVSAVGGGARNETTLHTVQDYYYMFAGICLGSHSSSEFMETRPQLLQT